jgi:GT2 family glycosyltransferase
MKSNITASIVLYNTSQSQLLRVLDCIASSNSIGRVILVDNSPTKLDSKLFSLSKVTYIHLGKNLGYGAGHNIAIRLAIESDSDFHFVLNPDIYFQPEEIQKMLARMRVDESVGQLMPKVIYPNGNLQYLCKLIPTPFDLFFRRFLRYPFNLFTRKREAMYELRFTRYCHEMNVPCLSGCFMLFRISALKQVGLFDERFFMYTEDFDITRRMHTRFKTLFFPDATVVHEHAKESYKNKKMLFIHILSVIRYFNKWGWFFDAERKVVNSRVIELLRKQVN